MAKKADITEVVPIVHTTITKLTVDYPNEGINDIARKINQIIDLLHENH